MRHLIAVPALFMLIAFATDAHADEWSFDSYLKQHAKSDWTDWV